MTTRPRPTSHQEVVAIRFGLFYEHQLPRPWSEGQELKLYQDALDQVEIADRVGFDYVWEVEHHFLEEYSHSSAPEVFLGAASQRTKRI
ncbi:MAG: LLM class flavin-dependent oxidoreductase, partial [Actinomadura sp.]